MKKTIMGILFGAALAFCGASAWAYTTDGDIYDILPCDVEGNEITPEWCATNSMKSGDTAYFIMRFIWPDKNLSGTWKFEWVGMETSTKYLQPRIGIFVSGQATYAEYDGTVYNSNEAFTDIKFKYTVQAGDFALPIRLAVEGVSGPEPASDSRTSNTSSYYLDKTRYYQNENYPGWRLQFKVSDSDTKPAKWQASSTWQADRRPTTYPDRREFWNLSYYDTDAEEFRGFYVKTIDFSSEWEDKANNVWRTVHQGPNGKTEMTLDLVPTVATAKKVSLYVWSTNESAIVVTGPKVREVEMPDPLFPTSGKVKYKVATIDIEAGRTEPVQFTVQGLVQGERSGIVLCSDPTFTVSDSTGDILPNFVSVPMLCTEPEEPTITATVDGSQKTVYVDSDELTKKATITVAMNPDWEERVDSVKVVVTPKFEGTLPEGRSIYDFVRISADASVSTLPSAGAITNSIGPSSSATKKVYVYALGAINTWGDTDHIKFDVAITEDDTEAIAHFGSRVKGCQLSFVSQKPVIESLGEKSGVLEADGGVPMELSVKMSDDYLDRTCTNGYEITVWKNTNISSTKETLSGRYRPNNDGLLFKIDDKGQIIADAYPTVKYTSAGTFDTEVWIKSPVSGETSEHYAVKVNVTAPGEITFDKTEATVNENEEEEVELKAELSKAVPDGYTYYLFLAPQDDDDDILSYTNRLSGKCFATTNKTGNITSKSGVPITKYGPKTLKFLAIDGDCKGEAVVNLKAVLCTTKEYAASNCVDYASDGLALEIKNVNPELVGVTMKSLDGTITIGDVTDGGKFTSALAKDKGRTFYLGAMDVSQDLEQDFKSRWRINSGAWSYVNGNINEVCWTNYFNEVGSNLKIEIEAMDKDAFNKYSSETVAWSDKNANKQKFSYYVDVIDQPEIVITAPNFLYENAADDAEIQIDLTANNATNDFTVAVYVYPYDLNTTDMGNLAFTSGKQPSIGATNVYYVTFKKKSTATQHLYVDTSTLDGTVNSRRVGWEIAAAVVSDGIDPESDKPLREYYVMAEPKPVIKVWNADPTFDEPTSSSDTTNYVSAAVYSKGITWTVFDVNPDITNATGLTVSLTGATAGSCTTNVTSLTDLSGVFYPDFSKDSGYVDLTLSVKDKDKGYSEIIYHFNVEPANMLYTRAVGPSAGGDSEYKNKAKNLGEGRIFVDAARLSSALAFEYVWNCGSEETRTTYAIGYKVGNIDNGALDDFDVGISDKGASTGGDSKPDTPYKYPDSIYDSFFYAWVRSITDENGNTAVTLYGSAIDPEHAAAAAPAGRNLSWSSTDETEEDSSKGSRGIFEAVFSKEKYPTDNMGDINGDGIPDLYYSLYTFTSDSEDTSSSTTDEGMTYADLDDLSTYNEDGDYLPGELSSSITAYTTNLTSWVAFKALWEVRGFGSGLNNAPAIAGVTRVEPNRVYLNPDPTAVDYCATSTLSKVEYMAWQEYKAAHPTATEQDWSPERPTDPTMDDTDGDGISDGIEYYYWYRAHVGYLNDKGEHEYLTGRRFDPRNPGEGSFISSEEITALMDPISDLGVNALTQDTDNDGLVDLLECYLGTSPFDFDTDRDGLPDGWEVMVSSTDPLSYQTRSSGFDTALNNDGDAMAITSPALEESVKPAQCNIRKLTSFAVVDPDGDTDGMQWYVVKEGDETKFTFTTNSVMATEFVYGGEQLVTPENIVLVDGRLAKAMTAYTTVTNEIGASVYTNVLCHPIRIAAGVKIENVGAKAEYKQLTITAIPDAKTVECNAAWVYGNANVPAGSYGFLAIARYQMPKVGAVICEVPSVKREVCYLHYLVYQQFGFDARTAWKPSGNIASRWAKKDASGKDVTGEKSQDRGGYVLYPTRSRAYAAYDEFLVMSFFLNNGCAVDAAATWADTWNKYTTRPNGLVDVLAKKEVSEETTEEVDSTTITWYVTDSINGADTDNDGVPDGWELYIMGGNKEKGRFVFANPYDNIFSPFVGSANSTETDAAAVADSDGLSELREFAGTDCCKYYADIYTDSDVLVTTATICKREDQNAAQSGVLTIYDTDDSKWLNKFLPTDPWNADTDGDGLKDGDEGSYFIYGSPADDGAIWSIPGAGLNPCSVDTDLDGLPDGWEYDYKGSTIYAGDDATYLDITSSEESATGNPLEGLIDGMDGTVPDAYNLVKGRKQDGSSVTWTVKENDGRRWSGKINRDYDHDGLENWQEYLVGTMRCWRYDDPLTPFNPIRDEDYGTTNGAPFDASVAAKNLKAQGLLASDDVDEFWYETLINKSSPIYNPRLVTGTSSGAQYFSRVTNGWDIAFTDYGAGEEGGSYYYFKHRIGSALIEDLWTKPAAEELMPSNDTMSKNPSKYISCSPIEYDTDRDGMDDYYELFHGMNPLLGVAGVSATDGGAYDVIYECWGGTYSIFKAWDDGAANANVWTLRAQNGTYYKTKTAPRGTGYDFEYYPWLNGLATADPDGDDIRNQIEAIMPRMATTTWLHTDPTPLWMTDMSYSNSLTRLYFRLPTRYGDINLPESFKHVEGDVTNVYYTCDCDGYERVEGLDVSHVMHRFVPDQWDLAAKDSYNWMYSFEENEGFDTDHDALSDNEEVEGKYHAASDPQYADSPNRRQAMYFQGPSHPSILQTMPREQELYPIASQSYPDDPSLLTFTVEAWVNAESLDNSTIIERAIWSAKSNPGDQEYIRKNFLVGIRDGKWYAKYEYGTLLKSEVAIFSKNDALTGWHHIAATYDGAKLTLYVDGVSAQTQVMSAAQPEYGTSALSFYRSYASGITTDNVPGKYWFDNEYKYFAIIVGGSVKQGGTNTVDSATYKYPGRALDLSQARGFGSYENFFKGYIDEIRIWDGARDADDIFDDVQNRKRYTNDDVVENRSSYYKQWAKGEVRYAKNSDGDDYTVAVGVVPELRYHYSFDSLPASENVEQLAKAPHGFNVEFGKPYLSRPLGYEVDWWKAIIAGYEGTIYSNPAWVPWIQNTVAHLPRYDGTTLDSVFWSEDYAGATNGTYCFARTAEPVSKWTQLSLKSDGLELDDGYYRTTASRHHLIYDIMLASVSNDTSRLEKQYQFTGRHLNQVGDDLLPVGGAFVKYCSEMWDDNGASTTSELAGNDGDYDGLPDWWETYADQNYRIDEQPFEAVNWDTDVNYHGVIMKANEAFLRDLAKGMYPNKYGSAAGKPSDADYLLYAQTADEDGSKVPDWWEDLYKITGEDGLTDTDNDGLSNYNEYLASEVLPFNLQLNPRASMTDSMTLDSFIKIGKLYLGEMLTDHDMIEDHWERSLEDPNNFSANVWDALKDGDEDGWNNFDEARYSGYCRSTLAQLVSHVMGTTETLDAPIPTINLTVRYNGKRTGSVGFPDPTPLKIEVYSDDEMQKIDASYTITPGTETDAKYVYLGSWEDRVVRGTMSPGHINIDSVNIEFIQVLDSALYSWTDSAGTHISRPYSEFKAALDKDDAILQNVQSTEGDTWLSLVDPSNDYTTSDKAVTVARDGTQQFGIIRVYSQDVGTLNIETGEFEFDMSALNKLTPNYTYSSDKDSNAAWGYKEAIFRLSYKAKVPNTQYSKVTMTLGEPDTGFVRGGKNSIVAFYDIDSDGAYTPGTDPFGVLRDVNVGWYGASAEIEVSEQNAISPRIDIWSNTSDRDALWKAASTGEQDDGQATEGSGVPAKTWISVVRMMIDRMPAKSLGLGIQKVVYSNCFESGIRTYLHEGDFLANGALDLDWDHLKADLASTGVANMAVTNVTYAVVYGSIPFTDTGDLTSANVLGQMISRNFEYVRTAPTALEDSQVCLTARPTFKWRIDGESATASQFGTTYTAFRVKVADAAGRALYTSDYTRMPAPDANGVYSWTAPLCVNSPSPSGRHRVFNNLSNYTWQVFCYNAKFRNDEVGSKVMQFRMNVTENDSSTASIKTKVCYAGPATNLVGHVHVQAFERPDFSGDPVAEGILTNVTAAALSPTNGAEIALMGLNTGTYFLRAYIDTDEDCVHDDWESWGYLCERDRGNESSTKGIFNPVSISVVAGNASSAARKIYIEDCDTDGDWFPDAWEAEQNGNVFDAYAAGQGPVTGSAELIGVNTNLVKHLDSSDVIPYTMLNSLRTTAGVSLLTGKSMASLSCSVVDGELTYKPTVETVAISSVALDSESNEVVLGLTTENEALDSMVSALYTVNVKAPVTVKVYRVSTLAEQWSDTPFYTETLDIGSGAAEVRVALEGVDLKSGFYKVEVVQ